MYAQLATGEVSQAVLNAAAQRQVEAKMMENGQWKKGDTASAEGIEGNEVCPKVRVLLAFFYWNTTINQYVDVGAGAYLPVAQTDVPGLWVILSDGMYCELQHNEYETVDLSLFTSV